MLVLDTFEQLSALEDWAHDLAQRLHPNVLLVIAGRALPAWGRAWPAWMAQARVEDLKPLTPEVMRELERLYDGIRADEETGIRLFQEMAENLVNARLINRGEVGEIPAESSGAGPLGRLQSERAQPIVRTG